MISLSKFKKSQYEGELEKNKKKVGNLLLPKEVEKLLLAPRKVGKFVPDEYDVEMCDIIKDWREVSDADIALVGVPFDTGVMIRRGCRFGPDGVRNALVFSTSYEPSLNIDLSTDFKIADFGDIDVMHTDVLETHKRIEKVITGIYKLGVVPLIIGGDHSIAYPDIKSLINSVEGNIGVIMIDAHLDVRKSHHGEISSGTPFRRLMEESERPLRPENLVEIGINGWHNSKYYMDYCKEKGVTVITAREVHKQGIENVVSRALDIASNNTKAIFLSFDIDGLDFAAAPGTCAPNPGGLTSYQALEAVWLIGQHPLSRGMDIVEVAPPLDNKDLTSLMGAALVMQYFGATKKRLEKDKKGAI